MTSAERREQLIAISRGLFASRGFEGTSVEEIAASAMVSKPVVYEHFGGKEGLYAVVVDREVRALHDSVRAALTQPASPRQLIELGALALLDYIDTQTDGFRILARDSPLGGSGGFASILNDITARVEDLLGNRTEWTFSNWQRNPKLAADTFRFTPPAGVDVIGEPTEAAEAIPLQ